MTSWGTDPYTYGSYSSVGINSSPLDREAFLSADMGESNNLYFAGEHTSLCYPGTVHGAYWSGVDAANRVMGVSVGNHCSGGGDDDDDFVSDGVIAAVVIGAVAVMALVAGIVFFHSKRSGRSRECQPESDFAPSALTN